jgi:hypothetical protein
MILQRLGGGGLRDIVHAGLYSDSLLRLSI